MQDRRAAPRQRIDAGGLIVVDEHRSIACLVYDLSNGGVRLTMPDTSEVPATFLLSGEGLGDADVCVAVWRTHEEIGARFASAAA
ncbi:PilZ domain-containing protein [Methylobacterium sp. sgz302541]|uniref:PilZ domain-containing protein n=1 Tax=unclassified Methylobacterium TaxID=2615210 RepID=UPI003D35826B